MFFLRAPTAPGWPRVFPWTVRARRPTRRIDRGCSRGASTPRADTACSRRTQRLTSGVTPPGSSTVWFPLERDHRSPRDRTDGAGGVLRRVACVASSGRAPLPSVWRGRSDDRLSSRPSHDRGVQVRPLSQGLQRVHLEASLRDPAASRRTGLDARRTRDERPGVSNRLHGWCRIGRQR